MAGSAERGYLQRIPPPPKNPRIQPTHRIEMGERNFLAAFLIAGAVAVGFGLWAMQLLKQKNLVGNELLKARTELEQVRRESDEKLEALEAAHDEELVAVEDGFQRKIDELKARQSERISNAYAQFNDLVGESNEALAYIGEIEAKLRMGQEATEVELEKLGAIASALAVLGDQYRKPMAEFQALGDYFAERAAAQPDAPDKRLGFLKRIFSRNFREQERTYREDLAKQQAYQDVLAQFTEAYQKAQAKINAIGVDLTKQAAQVYALIDEKSVALKDLESFFKTSREALDIHQQMLEFEPEVPEPAFPEP